MDNKDEMIEKFILDNIDGFQCSGVNNGVARFENEEMELILQPNIEELEEIITSNYNSKLVWIFSGHTPTISINSSKVINELKKKISNVIEHLREQRRIEELPQEQREEYYREQFIKKYIK